MKSVKNCYNNSRQLRKEVTLLLLVLCIFIPSIVFVYIYTRPYVEKIYVCDINSEFQITPFSVRGYNQSSGFYETILLSNESLGESWRFKSIDFYLHNYEVDVTAYDYEMAFYYQNSSNFALNVKFELGEYLLRSFNINIDTFDSFIDTYIRFKSPSEYKLFHVAITIELLIPNFQGLTSFGMFFNTESTKMEVENEFSLTLLSMTYSLSSGVPYSPSTYLLFTRYEKKHYSWYLFDFSFR